MAKKNIGSVNVNLTANAKAFQKGFDEAEKKFKSFQRQAKRSTTAVKGSLDKLQASVGSGSKFQRSIELLQGGGAVAGAFVAAQTIEQIGLAMRSTAAEIRKGNADYGDLVANVIKSIPIFGKVVTGLRGMIDGFQDMTTEAGSAATQIKGIKDAAALLNKVRDLGGTKPTTSEQIHDTVLEANRKLIALEKPMEALLKQSGYKDVETALSRRGKSASAGLLKDIERIREQQLTLIEVVKEGAASLEKAARVEDLKENRKGIDKQIDGLKKWGSAFVNLKNKAVKTAKSVGDAWKERGEGVGKAIDTMVEKDKRRIDRIASRAQQLLQAEVGGPRLGSALFKGSSQSIGLTQESGAKGDARVQISLQRMVQQAAQDIALQEQQVEKLTQIATALVK